MSERGSPFTTDSFDTVRRVLVTFAWIWREIFKLVRLPFPFFRISRRFALDRYIGPSFCIVGVEFEPLLGPGLGVRLDRLYRTFRLTHAAIDAFFGMNDEHIFALVEAINGAHLHAIHQLTLDAAFIDDICQMSSSFWGSHQVMKILPQTIGNMGELLSEAIWEIPAKGEAAS
jgi:hypothetical protein